MVHALRWSRKGKRPLQIAGNVYPYVIVNAILRREGCYQSSRVIIIVRLA